jgi:cytochrome P450
MSYTVETKKGVAEFLRFRRNPLDYFADAGRRSVDITCLRFGSRRIFQVNHPDLIRDVLVTHDWNFIKGMGLRAAKPVLGNGLLVSEGELHRRQRRLAQGAFHSSRLEAYARVMVKCAEDRSAHWTSGATIPMNREMGRMTLEIVGRTLFTADLSSDAFDLESRLCRAMEVLVALNHPLAHLLSPVRSLAARKAASVRGETAELLRNVIDEHRNHPDNYDDLLSMLIESRDDAHAGSMSDQLLLDECLTLFLAGHESTADALTWTWYLLSQHPAAANKLHAELERVLAGASPTMGDLRQLRYTEAVFKEVLRLYPPAWVITREAVSGYRLGDIEVPAGSTVVMSTYATHRDPRYWESPEAFRPERWIDEGAGERPKFTFFPFGAGSRMCVGEHFAMMEAVLAIAVIAMRWRFDLIPGQKVELWPQITLRARNGIYLQAERLGSSQALPSSATSRVTGVGV